MATAYVIKKEIGRGESYALVLERHTHPRTGETYYRLPMVTAGAPLRPPMCQAAFGATTVAAYDAWSGNAPDDNALSAIGTMESVDGRRAVELLEYAKDGVRPPGDDTIPMSLTTGRMLMAILPEIQRATTSAGFAWFRTGVNRHTQALCRRDIFRGEL